MEFAKGRFVPKFCKPYRAQTKGKVERLNSYIKGNFYKPLRAQLQGSGIAVTPQVLNSFIFGWIEKTNQRIHGTTKEKPAVRFEEEKKYLQPYIPAKEIIPFQSTNGVKAGSSIPDIDISYYTTLNDYEKCFLGEMYA